MSDVVTWEELEQGRGGLSEAGARRVAGAVCWSSRSAGAPSTALLVCAGEQCPGRPHRFTEPLPREESWVDICEACERDVDLHDGPHAARKYQFVARGIAGAFVMVGAGSSYRDAPLVARERAKRLRPDRGSGELRFSRHGSLVMDCCKILFPIQNYRQSQLSGAVPAIAMSAAWAAS